MSPRSGRECRRGSVAVGAVCYSESGTGCGVHRVVRAVVIGLMAPGVAAVTIRDVRQIEIAIDVTGRAGRAGMKAIENETGRAVIETRTRPARGVMTRTALRDGETLLRVDRVIRLLIGG